MTHYYLSPVEYRMSVTDLIHRWWLVGWAELSASNHVCSANRYTMMSQLVGHVYSSSLLWLDRSLSDPPLVLRLEYSLLYTTSFSTCFVSNLWLLVFSIWLTCWILITHRFITLILILHSLKKMSPVWHLIQFHLLILILNRNSK